MSAAAAEEAAACAILAKGIPQRHISPGPKFLQATFFVPSR